MRAKDVMSTPVVTVRPTMKLEAIAALLLAEDISAVPVGDESQQLLGIVTVRFSDSP